MPKNTEGKYYFVINVDRETLEGIRGLLTEKNITFVGDEGEFSSKGVKIHLRYYESIGDGFPPNSLVATIVKRGILAEAAGVTNETIEADARQAFTKAVEEVELNGQTPPPQAA